MPPEKQDQLAARWTAEPIGTKESLDLREAFGAPQAEMGSLPYARWPTVPRLGFVAGDSPAREARGTGWGDLSRASTLFAADHEHHHQANKTDQSDHQERGP